MKIKETFVGTHISEQQWMAFNENGFVKIGMVADADELKTLQRRIDHIMLGTAAIDYDRILMQLDKNTDDYAKIGPQTKGHKGATLTYRKIEQLESDPDFLRYMQKPVFREACARLHGANTPITCHRAMFMNKPAKKGSILPWHQDAWTMFDRPPLLTIYTALDAATIDNGCVQLIPRSHRHGVINTNHGSGFLTEEQAREHCPSQDIVYLELEAGEVALLHNWTLHRSDMNRTDESRRAFSVNYMDGKTRHDKGETFPMIFGEGQLVPEALEKP